MRWVSAPGASGKKSRFGGATEPLVWAEFHLYQSANGLYIHNAEVKEDFLSVRSEPKRLFTAMRCYKRVKQILMTGHESNQILTILFNIMLTLDNNCPEEIAEFRFNWRLLRALGLAPSLRTCSECGSLLKDELHWSNDGLLCAMCGGGAGKSPLGMLRNLQKAALLDYRRFAEWSKRQEHSDFYLNNTKKLMMFFTNFN